MGSKSQREISERDIQTRIAVASEAMQAALEAANTEDGAGAFSVTYVFPAVDLSAGNVVEDIQGPPGLRGLVKAISVYNVTVTFNAVTTAARIDVGIQAGDTDAYVISAGLGTLAADAALTPVLTAGVVGTLPIGEDALVTFVAPTGGTPAGTATFAITINYFL